MHGNIYTSQREALHCVRQTVSIEHGDAVAHSVSGVKHHACSDRRAGRAGKVSVWLKFSYFGRAVRLTGGSPGRVEREHRLHGHVGEGNVETLKHDLHHPPAVLQRVHGRLGQQHWVIVGSHAQLLEGVMPNLKGKPTSYKADAQNTAINLLLPGATTNE